MWADLMTKVESLSPSAVQGEERTARWVVMGKEKDEDKKSDFWTVEREGQPYAEGHRGYPWGFFSVRKWAAQTAERVNQLEDEIWTLRAASSSPTATVQGGEATACLGCKVPTEYCWAKGCGGPADNVADPLPAPPSPAPECAHDWVVLMATEGGAAPLDWNPIRRELAQCRSCLKWSFCGLLLVPYNTAPSLPTEGEG